AEDAAQDVFLRLWLARCRYEPRSRFTTYLYQIARTTWLERERRASCRPRETEWPDDEVQALPALRAPRTLEPQHQLFTRYRQWQAQRAVAQLSPIQREVFVLVHLEERSLREVAEVLGVPEGTVKSRLHAAVHRLRQCLLAEEEVER
ncbi:MAG TPA: RNA polymerase sigma factor, partial [Armatimonadota bacterium]